MLRSFGHGVLDFMNATHALWCASRLLRCLATSSPAQPSWLLLQAVAPQPGLCGRCSRPDLHRQVRGLSSCIHAQGPCALSLTGCVLLQEHHAGAH